MIPTSPNPSTDNHSDCGSFQGSAASDREAGFFLLDIFRDESAMDMLLGPMPASDNSSVPKPSKELPSYLGHLWTVPILTAEQEQHGFRKLNYLKYRASYLKSSLESCVGCSAMLDDWKRFQRRTVEVRNVLVESNLRLVVSLAKKYAPCNSTEFDEMICIGNATLIRSVDLFDYRRGVRFSTYAYRAIQSSFFSTYRKEGRRKSKIIDSGGDVVESAIGDAGASDLMEMKAAEAREQVIHLMEALDERDRKIVMARFGIDRKHKGVAFHVIAKEIGLSTSRTVQLFHRSMAKMRDRLKKRSSATPSTATLLATTI